MSSKKRRRQFTAEQKRPSCNEWCLSNYRSRTWPTSTRSSQVCCITGGSRCRPTWRQRLKFLEANARHRDNARKRPR